MGGGWAWERSGKIKCGVFVSACALAKLSCPKIALHKSLTNMRKKIEKKQGKYFTQDEQHSIIQEMISNGLTKREIWEKYTGQNEEHGQLLRWMKKLGYPTLGKPISTDFGNKSNRMASKKVKPKVSSNEESFENLQLVNRIKVLEQQLKEAELKAIAYSTMVDIAEKEFNIPIRKKFNTKP